FEFLRAAVQPFAVRAFVFLLGLHHDGKTLINRRKTTKISSKPVNAYDARKMPKEAFFVYVTMKQRFPINLATLGLASVEPSPRCTTHVSLEDSNGGTFYLAQAFTPGTGGTPRLNRPGKAPFGPRRGPKGALPGENGCACRAGSQA
ncbi:MAG TPA: hypothetical protein VMV10_21100, partial [Pirellulales bacterium]|nr:hypothetical protein [Pirellulales bacterium]